MKRLLIVLIAALSACAPEPQDVTISSFAKPFAKITLATDKNKAFVGLRNSLESGKGAFVIVGTLRDQDGFRVYWSKIAGQSATVYFKIEGNTESSLIRILTEPSPPPLAELLAKDLNTVAQGVRDELGLESYKLEPDR